MSSIVLDLGNGATIVGENLEYIGLQGAANLIEVKPNGEKSGSPVTIIGGGKNDSILLTAAGGSTALGLDGDDLLGGSAFADLLDGGEGNDILNGGEGNDTLNGGAGNDLLDGGEGSDILNGGAGNDTLNGGEGNDTLKGGLGDDVLKGGAFADLLDGGEGNDTLRGGFGADVLKGGIGEDLLDGGEGNDTLRGGLGADVLKGGTGEDLFEFANDELVGKIDKIIDFENEGTDMIRILGAGDDVVSYNGTTGIISVGEQEAVNIGKDLEDLQINRQEGTDNWEIS